MSDPLPYSRQLSRGAHRDWCALAAEHLPRRGRSFAARLRAQKAKPEAAQDREDVVDLDGVSF
jgi:hypothetical protein